MTMLRWWMKNGGMVAVLLLGAASVLLIFVERQYESGLLAMILAVLILQVEQRR